ncbi:MAG TPA: hypothetical protein VIV12_26730, partial [Streptosporangiaceae bacterium]
PRRGPAGRQAGAPDRLTAASPDRLATPDRPTADSADSLALEGLAPDGMTRASYAEPPPAATYRGLPRRIRQASLSPHLREAPSPAADRPPVPDSSLPPVGRTPEQARDLVASMQTGWQRGRQTEVPAAETGPRDTAGHPTGPRDTAGHPTGPRDTAGHSTGARGGAGTGTGMRDSAGTGTRARDTGEPPPGAGTGGRSTDAPVRKGGAGAQASDAPAPHAGTGTPTSGAAKAGSRPGAHAARRGESETQQSEEG